MTANPPQITYVPPTDAEVSAAPATAPETKPGKVPVGRTAALPKGAALPIPVRKPMAAPPPALESSPEVAEAQRLLASFGYEPEAANGRMGARTLHAIRLFEQDAGLPIDGRVSGELLQFMRKLAGPGRPVPVAVASKSGGPAAEPALPPSAPSAAPAARTAAAVPVTQPMTAAAPMTAVEPAPAPPAPPPQEAAAGSELAALPAPPAAAPSAPAVAPVIERSGAPKAADVEPLPVPKPVASTARTEVAAAPPLAASAALPVVKPGKPEEPIRSGGASSPPVVVEPVPAAKPKPAASTLAADRIPMPSETAIESAAAGEPMAARPASPATAVPPEPAVPAVSTVRPLAPPKPPVAANEDAALPVVEPMPEFKPGAAGAAATPAASAPATQLAAKPPAAAAPSQPHGEKTPSIKFASGAADLNDQGKTALAKVADRLKENDTLRVQLYAYAAGSEAQTSQARFLSLTRALAVRDYLVSQGVGAERVDVRVLGNKLADKGPADRVDPVVIQR